MQSRKKFAKAIAVTAAFCSFFGGFTGSASVAGRATGNAAGTAAALKTNVEIGESRRKIFAMRRLTESQYRHSIADIFGEDIRVAGRFDPILRPEHELVAVGATIAVVSPAGFEQFDAMARSIAAQVFDKEHRAIFLGCTPGNSAAADNECARDFIERIGPLIFRRPLTKQQSDFYSGIAGRTANALGDFNKGLELTLASMLVSPQFLFWTEISDEGGQYLDAWSKASRLSSVLWDTVPDAILLDAAANGELETADGLRAQVERMMASPRFEKGTRAFLADFLHLERVDDIAKDPLVYPRFTTGVGPDMMEQTLLTLVDKLLVREEPYPRIFTGRDTFLNRRLGLVYGIPVSSAKGWESIQLPATSERMGLLGQGAFLALFSHEGRSSPTLRGRAIREVLMCQPVPNPPANVDFSGFNDTSRVELKTAKQRLDMHNTDPVCAACHKITDPLGLPLESYDGVGGRRMTENGVTIDTAGSFEGAEFKGLAGLARLMAQSASPTECVARRAVEYAMGHPAHHLGDTWLQSVFQQFEADNFRFRSLMRSVVMSPEFFAVSSVSDISDAGHLARL